MPILLLLPFAFAAPAGPADVAPSLTPLSAHVLRPPPSPAEVEKWTATEYNSYLLANQVGILVDVRETVRRFVQAPSAEAFVAYQRDLKRAMHDGRANAKLLPPWHGDAGFRDAVADGYDQLLRLLDDDLPRMFALATQPEVHNADLAALEALQAHVEEVSSGVDDAIRDAQRAFATRQGFGLLPAEPVPEPEYPAFVAPGFPPAGSHLSAGVHVGFAMRYHNMLVARQVRLVQAINTFFQASGGEVGKVETARAEALAAVRTELAALRAGEAWQGDDVLRLALIGFGESLERLLAEDFATYTQMIRAGLHSQAEADKVNGIARDASPKVKAGIEQFAEAQRQFKERWALAAYEAWEREQGWVAPGQAGAAE